MGCGTSVHADAASPDVAYNDCKPARDVSDRVDGVLKAGLSSSDPQVKLRSAVTMIQRVSRGTIGRWAEDNRLSFELSNALESIEEAEGVRVAEFLSQLDVHSHHHHDGHDLSEVDVEGSSPRGRSARLSVSGPEEMRLDWPLGEVAVLRMLEGFCRGERLAPASVRKLLEEEAALLRGLPNIVDAQIDDATLLTVVGDLHGQLIDLLHIFRCQ